MKMPNTDYESFRHKKPPNSRDEPVLCQHITDNLANTLCYQQPVAKTVLALVATAASAKKAKEYKA